MSENVTESLSRKKIFRRHTIKCVRPRADKTLSLSGKARQGKKTVSAVDKKASQKRIKQNALVTEIN